jgi:hypothetical protein
MATAECGGCDVCGHHDEVCLYARLRPGWYICAGCYEGQGRPRGDQGASAPEHLREVHDAMLRRGGTDRYRVMAGKA